MKATTLQQEELEAKIQANTIDRALLVIKQASIIADMHMGLKITEHLGAGYAKEHPELIAAFMRTAAEEHKTLVLEYALDKISDNLAELAANLDNVGTAVENVAGVTDVLHNISERLWAIVGVSDNSFYLRVNVTQE